MQQEGPGRVRLFRERAGVIAPTPVWVCLVNDRIFIHEHFWKLVWLVITEWSDERHLVG